MEAGFIPMYDNANYLVNPYTGEVKSLIKNRLLKGTILRSGKEKKAKYVYYGIVYPNGERKKIKAHRIVAEAVLKRKLTGVPIGHKNGIMTMNGFNNLLIGKQKNNNVRYKVHEFFNGEYRKTYPTIQEFEKETGLYGYQFEKHKNKRVLKSYAYTFLISDDF